jgi:hypothetical protein
VFLIKTAPFFYQPQGQQCMAQRKNGLLFLGKTLLVCALFPYLHLFAAPKDTTSSLSKIAAATTIADSSLIVEDNAKPAGTPLQRPLGSQPLPGTVYLQPVPSSSVLAKNLIPSDTFQASTREIFRTLASFHKAMGIYSVVAGALAVIAGASILDKQDILPFSLSLITLGGVTGGIGIWEISIGKTISR